MKKRESDRIPWKQAALMQVGVAGRMGRRAGAEAFLKHYDRYRRYSPAVAAVFVMLFLMTDRYLLALIVLGFIHVHVLFNQLWWKLIGLEARQEEWEKNRK